MSPTAQLRYPTTKLTEVKGRISDIVFTLGRKYHQEYMNLRVRYSGSRGSMSTTLSAIAKLDVNPGLSMPNKLIIGA